MQTQLPPLTFRAARADELEAILALWHSVVGEPFCAWNEFYPGREEAENDFRTGNLFVLCSDEAILGTLSVVPENELDALDVWQTHGACEIARVAVAPAWRGHRLAGRMVKEVIDLLRRRGVRAIHLSVAVGNPPAQHTYLTAGFATVGRATLWGGDYLLMERTV